LLLTNKSSPKAGYGSSDYLLINELKNKKLGNGVFVLGVEELKQKQFF
jgi:hypothetical protein